MNESKDNIFKDCDYIVIILHRNPVTESSRVLLISSLFCNKTTTFITVHESNLYSYLTKLYAQIKDVFVRKHIGIIIIASEYIAIADKNTIQSAIQNLHKNRIPLCLFSSFPDTRDMYCVEAWGQVNSFHRVDVCTANFTIADLTKVCSYHTVDTTNPSIMQSATKIHQHRYELFVKEKKPLKKKTEHKKESNATILFVGLIISFIVVFFVLIRAKYGKANTV